MCWWTFIIGRIGLWHLKFQDWPVSHSRPRYLRSRIALKDTTRGPFLSEIKTNQKKHSRRIKFDQYLLAMEVTPSRTFCYLHRVEPVRPSNQCLFQWVLVSRLFFYMIFNFGRWVVNMNVCNRIRCNDFYTTSPIAFMFNFSFPNIFFTTNGLPTGLISIAPVSLVSKSIYTSYPLTCVTEEETWSGVSCICIQFSSLFHQFNLCTRQFFLRTSIPCLNWWRRRWTITTKNEKIKK